MINRWQATATVTALQLVGVLLSAQAAPPATRRFGIRYSVSIPAPPAGTKQLRMWLPYPESDAWQTIDGLIVTAPFSHSVHHDHEYGNGILFLEAQPPPATGGQVELTFTVTRREYVNRPDGARAAGVTPPDPKLLERFRQPDKLVPLQGKIAEVAREATKDAHSDADKARAIYDYVTSHLHYDKSGTGWGHGDAIWACDNQRGNCTDFHSLLIGMARSVGIPAKFEIGLPIPDGQPEGAIGGYHCWAAFYLAGTGWVPVDSSEASKFPAKRDYFFGALDTNRVRLSVGRDVTFDPPQQGAPVNYFVYPYVEVDGKPLEGVTQTFAYKNLSDTE
jgi:transglutaminase-like putative cysteine protease